MHELLQRRRDHRRAGRSGHDLHDDALRRWRRGHRRFFWSLTIVVSVILAVAFVVLARDRSVISWFAGLVAGVALCFFIVVRETGPSWIENRRIGAWAEQRTAKVLAGLTRNGWVVLHDLPSSHGNLDHVVIGPGGVFVLDTKQRSGQIAVDGDDLLITPPIGVHPRRERGLGASARAQGFELSGRLRDAGAGRVWVDAVVVIWGEFPVRTACGDRFAYVAGDAIADWLEARPPKFNRPRVEDVVRVARTLTAAEPGDIPVVAA